MMKIDVFKLHIFLSVFISLRARPYTRNYWWYRCAVNRKNRPQIVDFWRHHGGKLRSGFKVRLHTRFCEFLNNSRNLNNLKLFTWYRNWIRVTEKCTKQQQLFESRSNNAIKPREGSAEWRTTTDNEDTIISFNQHINRIWRSNVQRYTLHYFSIGFPNG